VGDEGAGTGCPPNECDVELLAGSSHLQEIEMLAFSSLDVFLGFRRSKEKSILGEQSPLKKLNTYGFPEIQPEGGAQHRQSFPLSISAGSPHKIPEWRDRRSVPRC